MGNVAKEQMHLYAVTDSQWLNGATLAKQVEMAIKGGVTFVQLREKNLPYEEMYKEALEVQSVCRKYKVPFVIDDNVELAKEINADGVHVGQKDMEASKVRMILGDDKIIGVTARTVEQAKLAEEMGADYLGVGAAFSTSTKGDAVQISHDVLREICDSVSIPVVAIGGINEKNVLELKGTHIDGVAVVSAIFAKEDILGAAKDLCEKVRVINGN